MIKGKHSFGKKSFEVKEDFIDREEAKAIYHEKLNNNKKAYNVLVFYGVGGIGKSKLRNEICRIHNEENPDGITFYLDLNAADDRNMGSGILKLVDSCSKKIDFKCFELAYALYFRKKNPGMLYGREKEMVTDNAFVGIGLNIIGVFDNGVTATAADIVEKTIRAISNRTIDKDVKDVLKSFDNFSIEEMEEWLPAFFKYDLQTYLSKHSNSKVLIVFDTFEALNKDVIEKTRRRSNERWIQEIIEYFDSEEFPNLLIIIFGRDRIEWDDEEWPELLDQHQLKEFETNYSREYLEKAGISDEKIINAILNNSKGYPLYLYLSLETYANIKNRGKEPSVEDFKLSKSTVVERFLKYLDKNTVEVLKMISIPNYYNDEIFQLLIKSFNISFPMSEYEQFNKYSFVSYDENDGDYYIHDLVKTEVLSQVDQKSKRKAHELLLKHYSEIIDENETKYIIELFFHARENKNADEFREWLFTPLTGDNTSTPYDYVKKEQARGEQRILIQILNGLRKTYSIKQFPTELVNIYVDIIHLGGDYELAVNACERYLSQFTEKEIINDEELLRMRIRKIHHSMFYLPVDKLIDEALKLADITGVKLFPNQYNELLFLIGGNLGVLSGRFDFATMWLKQSMRFAKDNNLPSFIHRTVRKQADIMLFNGQGKEAINLITQYIPENVTEETVDSRYKIYLVGSLGEIFRKLKLTTKAWDCYDIVENKSSQNNLPGWKAHAFLGKGMVKLQLNEYDEAQEFFDRAEQIYRKINQKWGIINTIEAKVILKKIMGKESYEQDLIYCEEQSSAMNYRYNLELARKIRGLEIPYLQLFFL